MRMELIVDRKYKKQSYTISNLLINDKVFCQVIEDVDRGLKDSMSNEQIKSLKKYGITAIPSGTYEITLDVFSAKFGSQSFYQEVCKGKLPRLLNVKGFEGILIHCGNTEKDSAGCLIVGENKEKGKVLNSRDTFRKLYSLLQDSKNKGEKITIKIL